MNSIAEGIQKLNTVLRFHGGHDNETCNDDGWVVIPEDEVREHTITCSKQLSNGRGRTRALPIPKDRMLHSTSSRFDTILQQEQSILFMIPTEVRVNIFEFVLCFSQLEEPVILRPRQNRQRGPSVLTILGICRRMLLEAEPIFYSLNAIAIDLKISASPLASFLGNLGPTRRFYLTSLTVIAHSPSQLLKAFQDLGAVSKHNIRNFCIKRPLSIRYTNTSSWTILGPQLRTELKHLGIRELKFVSPEAGVLSSSEIQRLQILNSVDESLRNAIA